MIKRKIYILSIVLSLLLIGCSNLIESTINIDILNTVSGIAMSEVNFEDEGLAFTLINDTDETIYYGTDISLEKKENEKWLQVPFSEKISFLAILEYLSPHSEAKFIFPLETWKKIQPGTYRVIKKFYLNEKDKETKYIIKEFQFKK
ncbi:immunoglobulin-like domain-containing protein [Sedimentibacter saalensis]|uniref:immunoglobulin-like domain-containing protein n=1 Tax=Sedimentibacter saalensis TaxID=130788 RepID=UPI00289A7A74|nr:immunoglobulin-like domain-containing protein [Sedimentibacter saalensis]